MWDFESDEALEKAEAKIREKENQMQADGMRREAVNHPDHYGGKDNPYECIKVLKAWLTPEEYIGFLKGNVIKYLQRSKSKGNEPQDVAKADWYSTELDRYQKEFNRKEA